MFRSFRLCFWKRSSDDLKRFMGFNQKKDLENCAVCLMFCHWKCDPFFDTHCHFLIFFLPPNSVAFEKKTWGSRGPWNHHHVNMFNVSGWPTCPGVVLGFSYRQIETIGIALGAFETWAQFFWGERAHPGGTHKKHDVTYVISREVVGLQTIFWGGWVSKVVDFVRIQSNDHLIFVFFFSDPKGVATVWWKIHKTTQWGRYEYSGTMVEKKTLSFSTGWFLPLGFYWFVKFLILLFLQMCSIYWCMGLYGHFCLGQKNTHGLFLGYFVKKTHGLFFCKKIFYSWSFQRVPNGSVTGCQLTIP